MTDTRRSRVLLVEGAPGAGKTRLLAEAAALAGANGFSVVDGVPRASDTVSRAAPHAPPLTRTVEDGFPTPRASFAIEAARALLRNKAEPVRTVVTLDDLHLADLPDLAVLCDLIAVPRRSPDPLAARLHPGQPRRAVRVGAELPRQAARQAPGGAPAGARPALGRRAEPARRRLRRSGPRRGTARAGGECPRHSPGGDRAGARPRGGR
ncbi:hypothetical protein ACQ4WX_06990 [Streptomyces lasalocidi]